MQLAIDPINLAPPEPAEQAQWTQFMRQLSRLMTQGDIRITCPIELRQAMHARWFENGPPSELLRVFTEIEGRIYGNVEIKNILVLLDKCRSDPMYICQEFDDVQRARFVEHLGEAGFARSEQGGQLGVLSPDASWSNVKQAICVEAEIADREDQAGFQINSESNDIREFLPRIPVAEEVITECAGSPCELIMNPTWGIRAVWVGLLGGEEGQLKFEIGPDFIDSVTVLGYHRKPGVAAACLRAMALIAGGRGDEVDGHETKRKGPGSKVLRVDGHAVVRSRIENKRPDANRLHWVRGPRPKFLNVTGHDGNPAL